MDKYAAEKEAFWRTKADAKDWDSVRADLEVYALAGEKVAEDPRRTEDYRDLVWSGLKIEPGPTRPGLTDADIAAVREVIRRKAAGFWVEDTTRTTVRKFAHDCIPTGPPVSSQPHSLRGESAQWVDDKLEEECKRGQLIRGSSAWGSAPFPTKEMPSYKRHRKRRLVVDYRRVNARIKRSTYYCRRGSDVLAAAVGSVWYTFVDAVSGFNQIRNTKRAREVLAIVARSGKYLPVGLTFGPINGPDDFNFVVDRAYAPGRGRRLKYTQEWIAYVDDLTVRTGRVIDGQFFTDAQAEGAVREACAKGAVAAPQSASSALEALGVRGAHNTKRANHDAARSDQNHPTRVLMLRMLGLFGCFCVQGGCFWGGPFPRSPVCGQKDFSSFVACSFVPLSRSQCFASRPRGSVQGRSRSRRSLRAQTLRKLPKPPPQRFKCVVEPRVGSPSPRSCLCTAPRCGSRPDRAGATDWSPGPSWSTTRPRCGPCPGRAGAAAYHYCTPAPCSGPCPGRSRARQVSLAHRRSSKAAGLGAAMGGGGSKGRGKSKSPGPKGRRGPPTIDDVQRRLVRCMRHGDAGCRGRFAPGGLYPVDELIEQLGITINQYNQAVAHDANQRKPRLDTSHAGFLRAFQGHSADCGHPMGFIPGPNVLEAEDSLEEEAAQEAEGVEEDSSSSDLPDTRAPPAAVKVKEDEEPADGAHAESTEEGFLELGQTVVSSAKEYLARSEALLRAQKLQSRILEVAGTAMVKLEKITKREESLKTLRREGRPGKAPTGKRCLTMVRTPPGLRGRAVPPGLQEAGPPSPPRPQRSLAPTLTATMDAQLLDAGWPLSRWCSTTCIRRPAMAPLFRPTWGSAPPHLLTLFVKTGGDGCSAEERTVSMGRCPCSE